MNNSRYVRCRVCLASPLEAKLQSIFEETGENEQKFEEVTGIDISVERNRNPAMICDKCLQDLRRASDFRNQSICAKVTYFSIGQDHTSSEESSSDEEDEEDLQSTDTENEGDKVGNENCGKVDNEAAIESVDPGEETVEVEEHEEENSEMFCDENMNMINSIILELLEAENIEDSTCETIEDSEISDEDSEISDEEIEKDHEVQEIDEAMVEVEKDVIPPIEFGAIFTVEEFSSLNLKKPKIVAEKLNLNEVVDQHEIFSEIQASNQEQQQHEKNKNINASVHQSTAGKPYNRVTKVKKVFKCNVCSKKFPFNCRLKKHMETHELANKRSGNLDRKFKCSFADCGRTFKHKRYLNHHEKSHNSVEVKSPMCSKDNANSKNSSKMYTKPAVMTSKHCRICFKLFLSHRNLKTHIESVHDKKRNFACDLCSRTFYYKSDLGKHMTAHIFVNDDTTNFNRPYRCDFDNCGKYFKTKMNVHQHKQRIHQKETKKPNLK